MLLRMDGRIEWTDLLMRMEYPGYTEKDEQKVRNRLQQRMARFRERFVMVSWRDTAGDNNAIRDRVLDKLTPAQLAARGGLGSTRESTPGSWDSQGRIIPVPGRRRPKTVNIGNTATQVQQPRGQTAPAGPLDASTSYTGCSSASPQVYQTPGTHRDLRTTQHDLQTNLLSPDRQIQTQSSPSSHALPNCQRNVDTNPTMGSVQQPYASTSHATSTGPQHYFQVPSLSPWHEATILIMDGWRTSSNADARTQHGQAPTVYAVNQSTQQPEYTLYAGPSETLREPTHSLNDEEDWDNNDSGSDEGDDGDDEQGDGESSEDYDDDDRHGWNEEADADMPSTEESSRMESLTPEECCELERYFKEDRIRMQMCLDGMISVEKLMLDMQNNQVELKQGLRRTRGETSDDDEAEEIQGRRAKRTRREGGTGSSSQPLSEFQEPTYNGFHDPQPGPWGEYNRQGALAKTSRFPSTRPAGSAVQRLHNDRLRRPAPKATVGRKGTYESLHYPQPELVMDGEWTVFHSHIDSQPTQYPPHQTEGEERLYTNRGRRHGGLEPYQSQRDNSMENSDADMNIGERQFWPLQQPQRQQGTEPSSSALNATRQNPTVGMPSHDPNGPTEGHSSHNSGASSNSRESTRNIEAHMAHRHTNQQSAMSTSQDDPFFPDELSNGMLNGHPNNNHVGSIYTRSQQQEIDEYYHRLMTPRPRPEAQTKARECPMPPPPRLRMAEPRTEFVADLRNPHSRAQPRQGSGVPQRRTPYNVPVAHAQSRGAQVPVGASQPADGLDPAVGGTTAWNPEWSAFINNHDAEPLLRAHYPDESPPVSPRGTPH